MRRLDSWQAAHRPTPKRLLQQAIGRLFGVEVSLRRFHPPNARRLDALRATLAPAVWQRALELEYGVFDPLEGELYVVYDAGLYSCLSVTLWSLCDLLAAGHVALKINFSHTLAAYKDEPGADIYGDLFDTRLSEDDIRWMRQVPAARLARFDHHGRYGQFESELLRSLVGCYFHPNDTLTANTERLKLRYLQPGQRYAGVLFRGTDKAVEVLPTDSALYVDTTERLVQEGLVDRILIQTDQDQVCKVFRGHFGPLCDSIDELPRTGSQVAIHRGQAIKGSRIDFARNMISAMTLISDMDHIVTYTGNMGAWLPLLRGHCRGVWQATVHGIVAQWPREG